MSRRRWVKPKCSSQKAAWPTQGQALRALDVMARQNAQALVPMPVVLRGAYQCRMCGAWHLTRREDSVHA